MPPLGLSLSSRKSCSLWPLGLIEEGSTEGQGIPHPDILAWNAFRSLAIMIVCSKSATIEQTCDRY